MTVGCFMVLKYPVGVQLGGILCCVFMLVLWFGYTSALCNVSKRDDDQSMFHNQSQQSRLS